MTLGALAFLSPWLLTALATLPLIYWLLRTVPPRPQQIEFPPTRILIGLDNKDKTPAKTPWWLLLIRLLAAALVIFALAEPVLNPQSGQALKGDGPVVITVDNGWTAGTRWSERMSMVDRLIGEAEAQNRPVVILPTAAGAKSSVVKIEAPSDARSTAAAMQPQPFAPDRAAAGKTLTTALQGQADKAPSIIWLTDGIEHSPAAAEFAETLATAASSGTFAVVDMAAGTEPVGLFASMAADGKLQAKVMRGSGSARDGTVYALSARSQRLGEATFNLGVGDAATSVMFDLPLELRNQVTRLEIANERSAGAISLLDQRSQWQRVGLISGESQEQSQPLLAPLYYIEKAVQPFAELIRPKDQNLASGIDTIISQNASVMMLADIGTLSGEIKDKVTEWVDRGGVLVRFAGPRLEKGGDDLLPVALRIGGRTLGGALSWSTPQPLNAFEDASLFAGLTVPADVTIRRQVLADPALLTPEIKVWARLKDGTPLVTSVKRGEGTIVLFHITANSDWSNLPISGLFVELLRRITQLGNLNSAPATSSDAAGDPSAVADVAPAAAPAAESLPPVLTLDGFGALKPPPPTAQPLPRSKSADTQASLDHPPGYYGAGDTPRAINVLTAKSALAPLPALPGSVERRSYESEGTTPVKPWLLAAALGLLFLDILAVLLLMGGFRALRPAAQAASVLLLAAILVPGASNFAFAQQDDLPERFNIPGRTPAPEPTVKIPPGTSPADTSALLATSKVTFGYVLTGDATVDKISQQGLRGLVKVLSVRTAVEPGDPIGVDVTKDEIAFFPILYWPVLENPQPLPESALAKIDAFMKQGGMIIFDTRDYGQGIPSGMAMAGEGGPALQRLLGRLDLPRIEPVPEDHVVTRSFYLLTSFPGRWDGGQLWVEAQGDTSGSDEPGGRQARRADGVSSIMVTPNDFASAWALDNTGRPLYPVTPGGEGQREMALRTGVNIVMHALTGNYKADQVHVPALLERLGQ